MNNLCIAMMNIMLKSIQIEFTPHFSSHGQNVSERLIYFKLFVQLYVIKMHHKWLLSLIHGQKMYQFWQTSNLKSIFLWQIESDLHILTEFHRISTEFWPILTENHLILTESLLCAGYFGLYPFGIFFN